MKLFKCWMLDITFTLLRISENKSVSALWKKQLDKCSLFKSFMYFYLFSLWLSVQGTSSTAAITMPTPTAIRDATVSSVDGMAATAWNTRALSGLQAHWYFTLRSHINVALSSTTHCSGHSASSSSLHSNWETPFLLPPIGTCLLLTYSSLPASWHREQQGTQMGGYWAFCWLFTDHECQK